MKFCINVIAYNEAKNIDKMAESAEAYMKAGGKIYLFDTGSTDNTVEIAEKLGFIVTTSKTKFHRVLNKQQMNKWRSMYKITCVPLEVPVTYFCFDDARNAAAKIPKEDVMFFADGCDHFINLDYKAINKLIDDGYNVFTSMQKYGGSKGGINRFYDRRIGKWQGHTHEHLVTNGNYASIPEDVFCIEHKIIEKDRGNKYMAGLIATHIQIDSGRWHYYVARELHGRKHYADARRLFQRRYDCLDFPEERAAAMCYAASCKKLEGGTEEEVYAYYKKAYDLDTTLREACFEYCQYHFLKKNWKEVLEGAIKCTKIIQSCELSFFEDDRFNEDHNLSWYLFNGYWNTGSTDLAIYHWRKFITSRNLVEERHIYWKTHNLAKYKYFPSIPFEIKQFEYGTDIFKCIGTIESVVTNTNVDIMVVNFARKFLPPCTSVIDTHASKGYFSISMSKMQYPAMVYAMECIDYKELVTNCFLNSRQNLKTYEYFAGAENDCMKDLSLFSNTSVECKTLDNLHIPSISLIKIDALDMYNPIDIITGAKNLISTHEPTIIVTRKPGACTDTLSDCDIIKNIGYTHFGTKTIDIYAPRKITGTKRVAIVCFSDAMKWDHSSFNGKYTELGDSEYAVVNLATALSSRGVYVDVWCNTPREYKPTENPRYLDYRYFHGYFDSSEYYNAVIYWRYGYEIRTKHKCTKNILWLQEYNFPTGEEDGVDLSLIDHIVVISENHKASLFEYYDKIDEKAPVKPESVKTSKTLNSKTYIGKVLENKVHVIPNAINIVRNDANKRVKNRCVYLNNRACGLEILVNDWEIIKTAITDAELYIVHGAQTWGINTKEREKEVSAVIKDMKSLGVHAQHTLTQQHLQSFLETCDFWLYPCMYQEPYNIQGVQAASTGVIPIVSDQAFIKTLTHERCVVWPIDENKFGKKCIEIMSLSDTDLKVIRDASTKLGKIAFCDLERQSSLFEGII